MNNHYNNASLKSRRIHFLKFLHNRSNGTITPLTKYTTNKIKMKFSCSKGHTFWATPSTMRSKKARGLCPICNRKYKSHPYSNLTFKQKIKKVTKETIIPLGRYRGSMKKMWFKCKICHYRWETQPNSILNNKTGCPRCARKRVSNKNRKDTEWFINKVRTVPHYKVIGHYQREDIPIWMAHLTKHPHFFKMRPESFLQGYRCPNERHIRSGLNNRHSTRWFKNQLNNLGFKDFILLTKYKGAKRKVKVLHKKCGNTFWARPDHFLCCGFGCNHCSKHNKLSIGEKLVIRWLKYNNLWKYFIYGDTHFIHLLNGFYLHADFISRNRKIVIEYDGVQHFYPIKIWGGKKSLKHQRYLDSIKNRYCYTHNIYLIRIPYPYKNNKNTKRINNIINNVLTEKLLKRRIYAKILFNS